MITRAKDSVFAVLYALAAIGLVYCCVDCLMRIGGVPGGSRLLYVILVAFGGYGGWLCGVTAYEIGLLVIHPPEPEQSGKES